MPNMNPIQKLEKIITKLIEIANFSETDRQAFSQDMMNGFLLSLLAEASALLDQNKVNMIGKQLENPETFEVALKSLLEQLDSTSEGKLALERAQKSILDVIFAPEALQALSSEQKQTLLAIIHE